MTKVSVDDSLKPQTWTVKEADLGVETLSLDQVTAYLSQPDNIAWIQAQDIFTKEIDACVDGREKQPIIANAGGEVALLTGVIVSLQETAHIQFQPHQIHQIFDWYLSKMGGFYLHTDEHGLEHLRQAINQDALIKTHYPSGLANIQEVVELTTKPIASIQVSLLSHLKNPDNIGCGHLKLMAKSPNLYGVSLKVLHGVLEAYYNTLWNGTPEDKDCLVYRILEGGHQEKAVIKVHFDQAVTDTTWVPKIRPSNGQDMSMFVAHPQVTQYIHQKIATAIIEDKVTDFGPISTELLQEQMNILMDRDTKNTLGELAANLPVYTLVFEH